MKTSVTSPSDTQHVLELLGEIQSLMELKGENPFKIRAYERAVHNLSGRTDLRERAEQGTLTELEGIGKGISEVITEYFKTGTSKARDELRAGIPPELLELTKVPGLGPKKAQELIEKLEIHSLAELEYACQENRLLKLKGFGPKLQQKILEGVRFVNANQGLRRLVDVFSVAEDLVPAIADAIQPHRVSEAGALRRRLEVLSDLEFVVEVPEDKKAAERVRAKVEETLSRFRSNHLGVPPLHFHYAAERRYGYELARATATPEHWKALGSPEVFDARTEEGFYAKLKLPWIPPEARETGEEVELARKGAIDRLLPWNGVKGIFHNHTNRSDGVATLEEMVLGAKKLGYEYIGISDHSKSAFYANGLNEGTLIEQEREIRNLQEKHPEIRIFWGIESDILADGALDYDPKILKRFDFVIASIHSRFKMDRETMTQRILEAIRNPYTRFLGHATGRLILGRKGYEVDMERLIDEAAKQNVAIEINANPARLDIDWRWGSELRRKRTLVSVNPDAHEVGGMEDTIYGIAVARKALLPSELVVNSRSTSEVEKWLKRG